MTEDRAVRQLLEETQTRLKVAVARADELERRSRLAETRAHELAQRVASLEGARATEEPVARSAETLREAVSRLESRLAQLEQATPRLPGPVCRRCGDPRVHAAWVGTLENSPLVALAQASPQSVLFKGTVSREFTALVCGRCGCAELTVDEPEVLLAAFTQASAQGE